VLPPSLQLNKYQLFEEEEEEEEEEKQEEEGSWRCYIIPRHYTASQSRRP
jgi:hypothetical protein